MLRRDWLATEFERHRPHLLGVAYRMLGSIGEAEDAVQEAWVRFDRRDPGGTDDMRGWLTVVAGRICLDMLRARRARRETLTGTRLPEPLVSLETAGPEDEAVQADSIGLALMVVLETLKPPERLAFVLHDVFAVPFEEIATALGRSPVAARQLASRARRRVRAAAPSPDPDVAVQRRAVDAFLAAARGGDFQGLLAVLDPDVVLRADTGGRGLLGRAPITGADAVARQLLAGGGTYAPYGRPATVNGAPGVVVQIRGRTVGVGAFTVVGGRITEIDLIADPDKLRRVGTRP